MDTVDKVLHFLRLASGSVAFTGHMYKEIEGMDSKNSCIKIGRVITDIKELDDEICALFPSKACDKWALISTDEEAFRKEFDTLYEAFEREENGANVEAKALYESIASNSKIEDNRIRAQAGLYRLSSK